MPTPLDLINRYTRAVLISYQSIGSTAFNLIKEQIRTCMINVLCSLAMVVSQNDFSKLDKSMPEVHWSPKQEQIAHKTLKI